MGAAVMCFGFLRRMEMLSTQIKDMETNDMINVDLSYRTKCRTKGFRFKSPEWLTPTFNKCISQFKEGLDDDVTFMRNYDTKSYTRVQNVGDS